MRLNSLSVMVMLNEGHALCFITGFELFTNMCNTCTHAHSNGLRSQHVKLCGVLSVFYMYNDPAYPMYCSVSTSQDTKAMCYFKEEYSISI